MEAASETGDVVRGGGTCGLPLAGDVSDHQW